MREHLIRTEGPLIPPPYGIQTLGIIGHQWRMILASQEDMATGPLTRGKRTFRVWAIWGDGPGPFFSQARRVERSTFK